MSDHTCHALGCDAPVPEARWGCPRHWAMVPQSLRNAIWRHYRRGQEVRKDPSTAYIAAAKAAIAAVALQEGRSV